DAVDRMGQRSRRTRAFLLRRFDVHRLTSNGRVLYETLLPGADADAALTRRAWGKNGAPYPVTHRNGNWRRAVELREDDRPRWSARSVNQDTNAIAASADRGVVAPDFVINATLSELRTAARRVAEANVADGETLVAALTRQADVLEAQRATAGSEPGMWRLPDGEEFYAQVLQLQLGAPVNAREAHERARARCLEYRSEAGRLLRTQGEQQGG